MLKTTTKRRKRIRKYPYFPRFSKAKAAEKQTFKKQETKTTVLKLLISQSIIRYTKAQLASVNDVKRENLTEEELLELRKRRLASSEACFRAWLKLDDKAAVLEELELMEAYIAYTNKLIALHGEGEAKGSGRTLLRT